MRGSNTPGRYSSPRTSTKSKSTKPKGRKSMSLPSSPLIRRSAAPHDVSTINEPASRTPDCEMKLIDQ
uniref:Uncharacterized protein n=1 Tax=Ciona savignyi TaxID=51511 RepID=H2YNP9_CIOSA